MTQFLERFAGDLARAGLATADVTVAMQCLARLLKRVRVGTAAPPPSSNGGGHHVHEGD